MLIHVLKAGKERSWSLFRSEVRLTGTSGLLSGRVKVDITARFVFEMSGGVGKARCLAVSRSRDSMWSYQKITGVGRDGVLPT